jgi:hypothetical protein
LSDSEFGESKQEIVCDISVINRTFRGKRSGFGARYRRGKEEVVILKTSYVEEAIREAHVLSTDLGEAEQEVFAPRSDNLIASLSM